MYSDTSTTEQDRFGGFAIQRSAHDDAMPWSHGAKALIWISLVVSSWAAVVLAAYSVFSPL